MYQKLSGCGLVVDQGYLSFGERVQHGYVQFQKCPVAPEGLLALVTDADVPHPHRFAPDDAAGLAAFLVERFGLSRGRP